MSSKRNDVEDDGVRCTAIQKASEPMETVEVLKPDANEATNRMKLFMETLSSDSVNRFNVPTGFLVAEKYEVIQHLGSGAYGNVYKVRDVTRNDANRLFALKIIKSNRHRSAVLLREVEILCYLNNIDPDRTKSLCVKMFEPFTVYRHLCILYELLGPNVHSVLALNKRRGFPILHVRSIIYQLCCAVGFLHQSKLVHHDVKPENIVFVHGGCDVDAKTGLTIMRCLEIRLIDFGSTVFCNKQKITTATTRQYRSPEIGLLSVWGYSSDIWSIGCCMMEFYTGQILLPCTTEEEKCFMIQAICGEVVPQAMGLTSGLDCFDVEGRLKHTAFTELIAKKVKPLEKYNNNPGDTATILLFDLIKRMLTLTPSNRIPAANALRHPFLNQMFQLV